MTAARDRLETLVAEALGALLDGLLPGPCDLCQVDARCLVDATSEDVLAAILDPANRELVMEAMNGKWVGWLSFNYSTYVFPERPDGD